MHNNRN